MAFQVLYRSTRPLGDDAAARVFAATESLGASRAWVHCEGPRLLREDDGYLVGASKPNLVPDPDDLKAAVAAGMPPGGVPALFDLLREVSRTLGVDWEIGQSEEEAPVGFIRGGIADPEVLALSDALSDAADAIAELGEGSLPPSRADVDDGPPRLRLWTGPEE